MVHAYGAAVTIGSSLHVGQSVVHGQAEQNLRGEQAAANRFAGCRYLVRKTSITAYWRLLLRHFHHHAFWVTTSYPDYLSGCG